MSVTYQPPGPTPPDGPQPPPKPIIPGPAVAELSDFDWG